MRAVRSGAPCAGAAGRPPRLPGVATAARGRRERASCRAGAALRPGYRAAGAVGCIAVGCINAGTGRGGVWFKSGIRVRGGAMAVARGSPDGADLATRDPNRSLSAVESDVRAVRLPRLLDVLLNPGQACANKAASVL